MSGAAARRKGHSFEREIASQFREAGYPNAQRQLEYQSNHCKGVDLEATGPYRIQCKKTKAYVSINTINEIKDPNGVPILITAGDRLEPMAVLPLKYFMIMVKQVQSAYQKENDLATIESCKTAPKLENDK